MLCVSYKELMNKKTIKDFDTILYGAYIELFSQSIILKF